MQNKFKFPAIIGFLPIDGDSRQRNIVFVKNMNSGGTHSFSVSGDMFFGTWLSPRLAQSTVLPLQLHILGQRYCCVNDNGTKSIVEAAANAGSAITLSLYHIVVIKSNAKALYAFDVNIFWDPNVLLCWYYCILWNKI